MTACGIFGCGAQQRRSVKFIFDPGNRIVCGGRHGAPIFFAAHIGA
jgi:hypothetical protein